MTNDRFKAVLPGLGSRRLWGILSVAILHFGAWYLIDRESSKHIRIPPVAMTSDEIIVRLYDSLPPRESDRMEAQGARHKTGVITLPALEKTHDRKAQPPSVTQSEVAPGQSKEASSPPSLLGEAVPLEVPEHARSVMDSEKVRKVIADIAAEEQREEKTSRTALRAQRSAAERAISQAIRPKCENGDAARAGNAQFTGLTKLPFLMLGAVSDKGCKW